MKTFIQISLTTGHVYEIPIAVVAASRAASMLQLHPDEFSTIESAMADTVELFKDDLGEVRDWALNNMNWTPDLEPHARLVRFTPPDIAEAVMYAEFSYHEFQAITGELDGNVIMKSPIELLATVMMESRQMCNVTVLNAVDGQPFGAIAVVMGSPAVVGTYISTLKFTGEQLTAGQPAASTH